MLPSKLLAAKKGGICPELLKLMLIGKFTKLEDSSMCQFLVYQYVTRIKRVLGHIVSGWF